MQDGVVRIVDWDRTFESFATRRYGRIEWVRMPVRMDSDRYCELLDHPNGAAHLGAWDALVRVAARCQPRGTLIRDNGQPHDAGTLERITRIPAVLWIEAIPRFVSIGWAEYLKESLKDCHMVATCLPHGCHMDATCLPHGTRMPTLDKKRIYLGQNDPVAVTVAVPVDHGNCEFSTGHAGFAMPDAMPDAETDGQLELAIQIPAAKPEWEGWFEEFWSAYWRRIHKLEARAAFKKLVTTRGEFEAVMAAIKAQTPMMESRSREMVPHAATWLRGRRWEDEVERTGPVVPAAFAKEYRDEWEIEQ